MSSCGLLPQILNPTREIGNSATIIDNIFTNNISNSIQSGNILNDLSDHYSQFIMVNRDKLDVKTILVYSRDYSKFSVDSFRDDVSIQNFDVEFGNVNNQFNDFYFKLEGCVDRHAPLNKLNQKETKHMSKAWISNELIKMINVRNKLFQRKKRQPNNINITNFHKLFRNMINREMKKSKGDHYNQFFENNSNNIKKTWDGIRSIINTKDSNISNITQLKINITIINNPKKIVEEVNNYFVNVGPNTERSIPRNPVTEPNIYLKNSAYHH